jgi:hypothetical protein
MLFNWSTKFHGACVVSSLAGAKSVSVIFAWGKKADGYSVEYRIADLDTDDERQRLDRATRLAMGHFSNTFTNQTGLINLAVDSTSKAFEGAIPEPLQ